MIFIMFHIQFSFSFFHDDKYHTEYVSEWKQNLTFWKFKNNHCWLSKTFRYCSFMKFYWWWKNKIDSWSILDRKTMIFWISWFKHNRKEAKINKVKKNQFSCFLSNYSKFKLHVIHALNHECCSYFLSCEIRFNNHCLDSQLHN